MGTHPGKDFVKMFFIVLSILVAALLPVSVQSESLAKKWVTGRVFETPESVIYDDELHILYVSNISGGPLEKNGKGFISKLSMKGEVVKLRWITGLNAPKGMGIRNRRLYVADIDELVEIDIENGRVVKRYPVQGSRFLNDIAIDGKGLIYISDSAKYHDAIYRFDGKKAELWLKGINIHRPNGLLVDENRLIVGMSGDAMLRSVDLETGKITDLVIIGSNIDGVAMDNRGNFLVSDWKGKTVIVDSDGVTMVLLDTTKEKVNAADICFLDKWKMLLIPTFMDNRVVACTLVY